MSQCTPSLSGFLCSICQDWSFWWLLIVVFAKVGVPGDVGCTGVGSHDIEWWSSGWSIHLVSRMLACQIHPDCTSSEMLWNAIFTDGKPAKTHFLKRNIWLTCSILSWWELEKAGGVAHLWDISFWASRQGFIVHIWVRNRSAEDNYHSRFFWCALYWSFYLAQGI